MRRLKITTESPVMEIHSSPARISIENRLASFRMHNKPARMRVDQTAPKMSVNWQSIHAQMGMRRPQQLQEAQQRSARQKALDAIATIAAQGNMLMRIEENQEGTPSAISRLGKMSHREIKPLEMVALPARSADISWSSGDLTIDWEDPEFALEWVENTSPFITVTPHSIDVEVHGFPKVTITVVEEALLKESGKKLDTAI